MEPSTSACGRRPTLDEEGLERMRKIIENQVDITFEEIKQAMGLTISVSAICRIVKGKLGFRYKKKNIHASERDSEKNKAAREVFIKKRKEWDVFRLIFIDESGITIGMIRIYGRAVGEGSRA